MVYQRDSLAEWYINGPLGIQQGFTLVKPPLGDGGWIDIVFDLRGTLSPRLQENALELVDRSGAVILRYGERLAWDATGQMLPVRLGLEDAEMRLQVNDADAVYPITIDPLVMTQQAYIKASSPDIDDNFGHSLVNLHNRVRQI